jgi:hypothetical protein
VATPLHSIQKQSRTAAQRAHPSPSKDGVHGACYARVGEGVEHVVAQVVADRVGVAFRAGGTDPVRFCREVSPLLSG